MKILSIVRFCGGQLKKAHMLFVVIALLAGLFLVWLVPPFWGTDENAHFNRAYQISSGHIRAIKQADGSYGGQVPLNVQQLFAHVDADARDNNNIFSPGGGTGEEHDVDNPASYRALTHQRMSKQLVSVSSPATSDYSPVAYAGPLVGLVVGRVLDTTIGHIVTLARLSTLFVYCALVFGALWLLRNSKARWIVFVIALLPNSIIQASIINPDAQLFGLSLLLFASLWWLRSKHERRITLLQTVGLAAITALLPLTKPVYFPFVLLALLLPATLWASKRWAWAVKASIVVLSAVLLLGWTYATRDVSKGVPLIEGPALAAQVDTHRQIQYVTHHVPKVVDILERTVLTQDTFFTIGMVGSMSWNLALLPTGFAFLAVLLLVLAVLTQDDIGTARGDRVFRWSGLVLGFAAILAVFAVFYITYTPVASPVVIGVQGRYFIPALVFVAYGLSGLAPVRVAIKQRTAPALFGTGMALVLLGTVVFYHRILF